MKPNYLRRSIPYRAGFLRRVRLLLPLLALSAALFGALGAGPDEPSASNINTDWEVFEGHAYADNRAAPAGVDLVACLGGCETGYVSDAVTTGKDGIYQVKVNPGQIRPDGRMVTFWLVRDAERVEADQDVLFRGNGETRTLDLNFKNLPPETSAAGAHGQQPGGVTIDLTMPSASELDLIPSRSPQVYVNRWSYGGVPLMPGFVVVLGLLLLAIGASLLMYRRRIIW